MSDPTGLRTQNVALISAGVEPADLPRGDAPDAPRWTPVRRFTTRTECLPKIHWFGDLPLPPQWRTVAVAHVGIAIQGCEKDPDGFTYIADVADYMTKAGLPMPIFHDALMAGTDMGFFERGPDDRSIRRRGVRLTAKWNEALRSGHWDEVNLSRWAHDAMWVASQKAIVARQVLRGLVAAFEYLIGVRLVTAPDLSAATLELRLYSPEHKYGMTALERAFDNYHCALRRLTDGPGHCDAATSEAVLGAPIPDTIRHNP